MSALPTGILLAAGRSQRFGSNKLLHPVKGDKTLLALSLDTLASVLPETIVVISPELRSRITELERPGVRVVINEQAEQGMGSSLACGVRASQSASGWLIALADMLAIQPQTIAMLAEKLSHSPGIIAPQFNQSRGHPVGFDRRYKEQLMALTGDSGARSIIAADRQCLELVPTDDRGVLLDIDYRTDLDS